MQQHQQQQQQQQQMSYSGMNMGGVPPGVVYVPIPIRSRSYEGYSNKQSVGLGIAQIVIGVLCGIFNTVVLLTSDDDAGEIGHGLWCGALFIITGSLGIAAGVRKQKCQIVGFMVMCIISAIFTISLLTIASVGATSANNNCENYGYYYDRYYYYYYPYYNPPCYKMNNYKVVVAMEALMAASAIIEAILAIWGSALCCKSGVCCCSRPVQTAVIPASYNCMPYNGQVIYFNQTQGGQGPYMQQQPVNTYQLGLLGPPFYTHNYVQPGWIAPPPLLSQGPQPPAYPTATMNQGAPEYSANIEGGSNGIIEPAKF